MVISDRALKRRVKRNVLNKKHNFLAVSALGDEVLVKEELLSLNTPISDIKSITGGVEFTAPLNVIYEANLWLSCANRLLMRIAEFSAPNTSALYNRVKRIPWEQFIGFASSISFSVSSRNSMLNHKRKVADIAASGALDRLALHGLSPTVRTRREASLEFLVRIDHNRCAISFNTSGMHLHKRGWRVAAATAPIRETLAAGVLKRVAIENKDTVVDPFCGSGTFPIEAALHHANFPPGARRRFAFENTPFVNSSLWNRLKETAITAAGPQASRHYFGFDLDPATVALASENAHRAGVSSMVKLDAKDALQIDFSSLTQSAPHRCLFVTNLPYGSRLSTTNRVSALSRSLVQKLNHECKGWTIAVVLKNYEDLQGLHLQNRITLQLNNGGLQVFLVLGEVVA